MSHSPSALFISKNETLAVAESLTAGYLQTYATQYSGASGFFLGGVTAYNIDQKVSLLDVDRGLAQASNCVHETVAMMMAQGSLEMFGSTIAAATTGYAEPSELYGVSTPYAFYAIIAREKNNTGLISLDSGRIEKDGLSRTEMQQHVAEVVWLKILEQVALR